MSKGAGRLERAVIRVMQSDFWKETSIEEICRRVYPDATAVEKKHRVAVLQVLHRLKDKPPRPLEERWWAVKPTKRRGYWRIRGIEGFQFRDSRTHVAYHEAGHALADLYFGHSIECIVVHTHEQISQQMRKAEKHGEGTRYFLGHVTSWKHCYEDFSSVEEFARAAPIQAGQELIRFLAGPIAEAHYKAKWPLCQRGVSQTYGDFYAEGGIVDLESANAILSALSDDPQEQTAIFRRGQELTQALIRSEPGWCFIKALAAKTLDLKHGKLGHHRTAAVFQEAFRRRPPTCNEWNGHWPPTLQRMRVGWLPPEAG